MAKEVDRHKYSRLRREATLAAQCDGDALRPWQKAVAVWWAGQPERPHVTAVQTYASTVCGGNHIGKAPIEKLLRNPAFLAAVQQYEEEVLARPRAFAESRMMTAVEAHFEGIDDLRVNKKWETLVKYTNPLLDRLLPKEHAATSAQIIQIVVGAPGGFAAKHVTSLSPIEIAAIEEVPAEITTS
jgi:hypothetical protein